MTSSGSRRHRRRLPRNWYSQGTQVVDFVENADGTVTVKSAGWMIPENANTWTSHVFKREQNPDGTVTYYGATGDFFLAGVGRNAIDIYKVTLPPAPAVGTAGDLGGRCGPDRLKGNAGSDRLSDRSGGRDRLAGGAGRDRLNARGGGADVVRCGKGRDRAKVDAADKVRDCERVKRQRR